MKLHRFIIEPQSAWSGSLRSDTLYGLICWQVAQRQGIDALNRLLAGFGSGKPPFALSSAMPADHLPMPCLPPISRGTFRSLAQKLAKPGESADLALFNALQKFKKFRKKAWLPVRAWLANRNMLSAEALFMWEQENETADNREFSKTAYAPHVSIDRASGRASDGQLFFMRRIYYAPNAKMHLYARTDDPQYLLEYLRYIGETGFGSDAGIGNGLFEVTPDGEFDAAAFDPGGNSPNQAALQLSVCASPAMQGLDGWYKLEVKRGKTGPGYKNPFKKPFLMLQEGSVLLSGPSGPFVLADINADKNVVQILQPLELPCRLQA